MTTLDARPPRVSETDESDGNGGLITRDNLLLAAVLFVGVAGTGVLRRELGLLGLDALGRVVFVLGYGGMVFVVWYGWIRPLDITGPTGNVGPDGPSFDGDAGGTERDDPGTETGLGTDAAGGADGGDDDRGSDRPATPDADREREGRTER